MEVIFLLIFPVGFFCFTLWNWWLLQRVMLDCREFRNPRRARMALLLAVIAAFYLPGFFLRFLPAPTGPLMLFLLAWYILQVCGLWFGCLGAVLFLWNRILKRFALRPRRSFLLAASLVLLAVVTGYCQAGMPKVRHWDLALETVPAEADGYRILLLSDIHLTHYYRESILDAVDDAVASWEPDLILHAGDFLDGPSHGDIQSLLERCAAWSAPDGKYAVFGNHDGYAGWRESRAVHEQAGFRLLGEHTGVPRTFPQPWLALSGTDDARTYMLPHPSPEKDVEAEYPDSLGDRNEAQMRSASQIPVPSPGIFNLLMWHDPGAAEMAPSGYDVMLSGHTHGGQLFPFNFAANLTNHYRAGIWHALGNGLRLYICQGTGYWGPPLRLFIPPEITEITLHHLPEEAK